MYFAFLSANQKGEIIEFVEIKAQTTSQSNERCLFLFLSCKFEFENFFWLEFILHQTPVHDSTIWWNRVEVILLAYIRVPSHLPNRVCVFLGSHTWLVDRLIVLVSYIVDKDCAIVKTSSEESWRWGVPVQTHDSCGQTFIFILRKSYIFKRPN